MTTPTVLEPFQPRTMLRNIRGFCLIIPWLLQLLGTNVLLSLLLPVSFVAPSTIYQVSSRLAYWIWKGVQNIFTRWNGARITTSGDELPQNESAIVVSNHVSWTDFYMIQELAIRANMLPYCRWFAKQQLRWVPFLGWGLWAMGMPLVSRQWDKDRAEMQRVFKGPLVHKWPMCRYSVKPDGQQLIVAQG
jgi:1-acyl-sn-glycerol-3-phosphate acyltransferase